MDAETLAQCTGTTHADAEKYAWHLTDAMARFGIDENAMRQAVFLGQVAVESDRLSASQEGLSYSSADRLREIFPSLFVKGPHRAEDYVRNPKGLSQLRYKGYHGRGLIQLTWGDTYREASQDLGFDYVGEPDLVAEPMHAALTACWFFARHKPCLPPADAGNVLRVTELVNGPAKLHLPRRQAFTDKAYRILSK
jgi:putative chitinase